MKLYTHVTDSHRAMFEQWLKPGAEREFEVCVGTSPQYGSGHWDDPEWGRNTRRKAKTMLEAVEDNIDDILVWSDCDVQILKPVRERLLELLGDHDIAVSRNDHKSACSGFYVVRCSLKTLSFFHEIYTSDIFTQRRTSGLTDQAVFCKLLQTLNYAMLPADEFWCNRFPLDLDAIKVHHANWIKGVDNKVAALADIHKKWSAQCQE
jgi:hypothetical protein